MPKQEHVFNLVLGGSILFWSIHGIFNEEMIAEDPLIHLGVMGLNIIVGILIIMRKPTMMVGSFYSNLISLPAFLIAPIFFYFSSPLAQWSILSRSIFCLGLILAITSFLFLGKNFAIFPALRGVTNKGPYQLVRHPAYLGELLVVVACIISNPTLISLFLFILLVPLLALRILEEEKILSNSTEYKAFKQKTKWRLVPLVW